MKILKPFVASLLIATAADAAPARIIDLAPGMVRGYDIALSFAIPSANVTSVEVRMSPVNITALNYASRTIYTTVAVPAGTPAGKPISLKVTGLTPNTAYYFAAKASDATGWCTLVSNVVMQSTKGSTKTLNISWTYSGSLADAIDLHYGYASTMQTVIIFGGKTYTYVLTGVPWGQGVYAQVTPYNAAGHCDSNIAYNSD